MNVRLSIHEIVPGVTCGSDILDDRGRLLLSAGMHLTADYLTRLIARGVSHVSVGYGDLAALRGTKRRTANPSVAQDTSFSSRRVDRTGEPYSSERAERFAGQLSHAANIVEEIGLHSVTISRASVAELKQVPMQLAEMLLEDNDQALASSASRASTQGLAARCVEMSLLAMSTAIELELPDSAILELGTAGLLHDIGLFQLPEALRDPTTPHSNEDWEAYQSHPELTVNCLGGFSEVSEESLALMLQVHELPDGSGFPRRLRANQLQSLTPILNAVEIYLTLTSPGPDRPAIVHHDAIRLMILKCPEELIDVDVMQAFLDQMTMYGIGSQVRLDDGRQATVTRSTGSCFSDPIVAIEGDFFREFTDLSESGHKIVESIHDPEEHMRLEVSQMSAVNLNSLLRTAIAGPLFETSR